MLDLQLVDRDAERWLGDIKDRLLRPEPMLRELGDDMVDYLQDVFDTANFGEWAPLSPATVSAKGNDRVLVDHGNLLDDLTGGRADVRGDSALVVTDEPSAGYLKAGARGMPRRDPAPEPPGRVIEEWAESLLRSVIHGRWR